MKKVLLSLVLLLSFSSAYALDSRLSSRENDALTCMGLFYIMTAISEPEELNKLFMHSSRMMGLIYGNLNFIRTNDPLTNGEISKAKNKTALRLVDLHDTNKRKVVNEYIQCNAWRADIAESFQRSKSRETFRFKNAPIPRTLNNIHLPKEKEEAHRRQLSIAMEGIKEFKKLLLPK